MRDSSVSYAPDWAMFGVDTGDGKVAIFASNTLSEVELRARFTTPDLFAALLADRSRFEGYDLLGRMRDMVFVVGATYADALRSLLNHWTPGEQAPVPTALAGQPKQLSEG